MEALLDILEKRDDSLFPAFCDALKESGNERAYNLYFSKQLIDSQLAKAPAPPKDDIPKAGVGYSRADSGIEVKSNSR